MEAQRVIGWGYEGKCVDDLLEFVNENSALAVVDVRLHAASRKPEFRKRALADRLERAGVRYLHLPELGNPKDNREAFSRPGSSEAKVAHERFLEEVIRTPEALAALDELVKLSLEGAVVVVCYENEDAHCHRSLVIRELPALVVAH